MTILNSNMLWQERAKLDEEQRKCVEEGDQDKALVIEGQIKHLDLTLGHVLEEEEAARNAPKQTTLTPCATIADMVLGPRDEFAGLEIGFRSEETQTPATPTGPTVTTVAAPTEIELELDPKRTTLLDNFGNTLIETSAKGAISYKQRDAQVGNPDTWGGVTNGQSATKERVIYKWKDAVANKETVAGYVPISKDSLSDYDDLWDIINVDLQIDLDEKTNAKYVNGSNSSGIIGVTNTTGIQTFSKAMGDLIAGGRYWEAARMMRTKVIQNARRVPTHIAMSPEIKEAIDLYKTSQGFYQTLATDYIWGMKVVEDENFAGIMVYDYTAARRRSIHGLTIEAGYYNDQFIKNELSILAEHTKALQVRYPNAFCYALKTAIDAKPAA